MTVHDRPGTDFDPWSPSFVADPYPAYAALREGPPIRWFEPSRQFLVSRYDDRTRGDHATRHHRCGARSCLPPCHSISVTRLLR